MSRVMGINRSAGAAILDLGRYVVSDIDLETVLTA